jgi:histidinol phosphatase-like PHP family hydrolase
MQRRTFIKNAGIAGGMMAVSPLFGNSISIAGDSYPVMDLHVHIAQNHSIDDIVAISRIANVQFGIVENPGYGVRDDASLKSFIDRLKNYPVYIGLQPMTLGWSKSFSPELLSQLDYILMDAQTIERGNSYGETLRIWNFDTYVDDANKFMETYVAHCLEVLTSNEPLTIFGWPLFLPVCIARDYYTLWTKERMQKIISAAKKRNIAFEINDLAHTPHEEFINMAKKEGLKFAFGSDTRDNKTGRLDYCKAIAKKCNLTKDDFFVPKRIIKK